MTAPRLLIVGPQGSGKGTQGVRIAESLGIPVVSTGDVFRANVAQGTSLPASMMLFTWRPSSVPFATFSRNTSPVETTGMPRLSAIRTPWVPLPEPWGPTIRRRMGRWL